MILGLSFRCVILSKFVDTNQNSSFNPSYSSIQSVVTLNGGGQNRSSGNTPVPQALKQNVKVKNSSSSVSNAKTNISTPGSGNNGPETREWETKASCPNPDEIISNVDFWNSYLDSKDFCPNVDIELDEDNDWSFKDIVEIPDEILSQQIRRLLAIQPTAELDKSVKSKHTYSNSAIKPFRFYSKEGQILTIKNRELEKIVYAHSDDLNLLNFTDRVVCPIQTDPNKFQRSECRAVTDSGKK